MGEVGAETGGAIWVAFLAAFVLAALTAFAYAELVTKYPRAAGTALYADRAFVDLPTVLVALVFIVLIALINLRGILEPLTVNAVFTLIEVTASSSSWSSAPWRSGQGRASPPGSSSSSPARAPWWPSSPERASPSTP